MSIYVFALVFAGTAVFLYAWPVATYEIAKKYNYPDWALIALIIIPALAVYLIALKLLTTR